jgi:hypothetical protein
MMRAQFIRAAVAAGAAMVLIAGCGSSNDSASSSSTSAASSSSSAASSSAKASTSASEKTSSGTSSVGATATSTVGAGTTELDAQSTTWFDTLCTGLAPFKSLATNPPNITSAADVSSLMTNVGGAMTQTGSALASIPPPTFQGGDTAASGIVAALQQYGPVFSDFGQKAAQIDPNDAAALQQLATDFETQVSGASSLTQFDFDPAVKQAVNQIPSCNGIFS